MSKVRGSEQEGLTGFDLEKAKKVFKRLPFSRLPARLAPREENVSAIILKIKKERRKELYGDDKLANKLIDDILDIEDRIREFIKREQDKTTRYLSKDAIGTMQWLDLELYEAMMKLVLYQVARGESVRGPKQTRSDLAEWVVSSSR